MHMFQTQILGKMQELKRNTRQMFTTLEIKSTLQNSEFSSFQRCKGYVFILCECYGIVLHYFALC